MPAKITEIIVLYLLHNSPGVFVCGLKALSPDFSTELI